MKLLHAERTIEEKNKAKAGWRVRFEYFVFESIFTKSHVDYVPDKTEKPFYSEEMALDFMKRFAAANEGSFYNIHLVRGDCSQYRDNRPYLNEYNNEFLGMD